MFVEIPRRCWAKGVTLGLPDTLRLREIAEPISGFGAAVSEGSTRST